MHGWDITVHPCLVLNLILYPTLVSDALLMRCAGPTADRAPRRRSIPSRVRPIARARASCPTDARALGATDCRGQSTSRSDAVTGASDTEADVRAVEAREGLRAARERARGSDLQGALVDWATLIAAHVDNPDLRLQRTVAQARLNHGVVSAQVSDHVTAIADYRAVVDAYAGEPDEELRQMVAHALFSGGAAYDQAGDHVAEVADYDAVVARFASDLDPAVRRVVVQVLLNRALTHAQAGDRAAAVEDCGTLVERYGDDDDSEVRR